MAAALAEAAKEEVSSPPPFFLPRFILAAPFPIFSTASNVLSSFSANGSSATNADSVSVSDRNRTEEDDGCWLIIPLFVLQDGSATKAFTLATADDDAAITTMADAAFIVVDDEMLLLINGVVCCL